MGWSNLQHDPNTFWGLMILSVDK
ncbi:hypothetical protein GJR93_02535 [Aminobacter sp. MDW-2]|nr:hypothetical protein [Aminobacter sp. MDW-2]